MFAGFVQGVLRATDAHDVECANLILGSYAERFHSWLGTSEVMAETLARLALEAACLPSPADGQLGTGRDDCSTPGHSNPCTLVQISAGEPGVPATCQPWRT